MRKILFAALFAALGALQGCQTLQESNPPAFAKQEQKVVLDGFVLDKTTRDEVVARFGKPDQEITRSMNSELVTFLTYSYYSGLSNKDPQLKYSSKYMKLGFDRDGKLVTYFLTSSFPSDSTNFKDESVTKIKVGETTKEQVLTLFGRPNGEVSASVLKKDFKFDASGGRIDYGYVWTPLNRKVNSKSLYVYFDSKGVVSYFDYKSEDK